MSGTTQNFHRQITVSLSYQQAQEDLITRRATRLTAAWVKSENLHWVKYKKGIHSAARFTTMPLIKYVWHVNYIQENSFHNLVTQLRVSTVNDWRFQCFAIQFIRKCSIALAVSAISFTKGNIQHLICMYRTSNDLQSSTTAKKYIN